MRSTSLVLLAGASLALAACSGGGQASLESDDQKASYGVGLNVGRQLQGAANLLDMDAFMRGVQDAMAEADPAIPPEELDAALRAFSARVQEEQQAAFDAESAANIAEGQAYLEENGARAEVTTTESGLQYEVIEEGDGDRPDRTDRVRLHYRGTLVDGTEFDSSYDGDPATFAVGGVIPGFTEALMLMPVGSTYRVAIPPEIGYGAQGSGGAIGPNETLIFQIELLEILDQG